MKFAHFFIDRPIFASVLSIVIVIMGSIALFTLPIAQYPDVAPPTIVVTARYPGANANVVAETVATPIEQEVNGVENMLYMSSQSTADGTMTLTITFKLGTNLNIAQVLVQNRVAIAVPRLPEEVRRLGITTAKRSPELTMVVHLVSPDNTYDQLYVGNYAFLQVKDVLARLPGVGEVVVFGARDYSMRVWLDPEKIASRYLTASDVVNAIREQNLQVAAGIIGAPPTPLGTDLQLTVNTLGRLQTEEEFGEIVVKRGEDGQVTRVRDVARIELAARDYSLISKLNGQPAAAIVIFQLPGSNAIETSDAIRKAMEELKQRFPKGLDYEIVYDTTIFVRESITAVVHTLFEAILLVVIVVIVFLQTWQTSLIPLLAVPVSLIGTFAVMAGLGFSLNNLSLFGLVLAIGIVVDDAIVVVENVERNIALGLAPRDATRKAMDEVSGPVVAVALVLSAVFIPTAFVSGITGQFYKQFALTIAVSTVISAFNSLTLSPALAALLLKPHGAKKDWFGRGIDAVFGWFFRGFNRAFKWSTETYTRGVRHVIRLSVVALLVYVGLIMLTFFGFRKVPTGFIPPQDKGYLIAFAQLPDGASLERTEAVVDRISEIARKTPGVLGTVEFPGFSIASGGISSNAAAIFLPLEEFENRKGPGLSGPEIAAKLNAAVSEIQEAYIGIFPPPPVSGLGFLGGFKMQIQDRGDLGLNELERAAYQIMGEANQTPGLVGVFTTFRANVPQLYLEVDRVKAKSMGVVLSDIFNTLQIYLGSLYVNDFNRFGRTYQVIAQADAKFRLKADDIRQLKARNAAGEMVPLGTLLKVSDTTGPERITRYNMYPAAELNGNPAPGVSSGEAIAKMEELAKRILPASMGFEWTELTLQEILAGNTALYIFPLCVLLVFLVLAALYESWSLPLAIILIVPMCLLFAIFGVWLRGMDNNVFTQIGFVVLVGLASKNAILIVEFAKQKQDAGLSRVEAAIEASKLRLRPILMTSLAFIFGVIPLVLASGAGAEMRQALGTTVFSGMLGVTFFGIFLTPVFYVVIRWVIERKKRVERKSQSIHSNVMKIIAPFLLLLFVSGCAVGPNYQEPKTQVLDSFTQGSQKDLSAEQVETLWWHKFNDEKLNHLIEIAVSKNHNLRIAVARLREARALRKESKFDLFPIVTSGASYTNQRLSQAAFPVPERDVEIYNAGFDATWELDFFGHVRRSIEARSAEVGAEEANRRDVLVSLFSEVARNYFELRGAQNQLEVARRNAENQRQTLDFTESRLEGGAGTKLDVSRARAQLNLTLSIIPPLEATIQRTIHRLSVLTGQQPSALVPELSEPLPLPQLPQLVSIGKPEDLLRRRPDIRIAERNLAAATARIGIATADLFPRVTFFGNVALESNSFSGLGDSGSDIFSFGPRIFWAAFDLGRVKARIKASDARAEGQLAAYELTVLTALEETENALVDFGREKARLNYLRESAEASENAAQLARQQFKGGVADFLTVLDTQRTLLAAQDLLAQSETRTATALIAVYKSLGGGWEEVEEPS